MTVLIIGGAFQGKRKIAEKLYPELPKVFNLHEIVRKCIAEGRDSMTLLDAAMLLPATKLAAALCRLNEMTKTGARPWEGCAALSQSRPTRSFASGRAFPGLLKEN